MRIAMLQVFGSAFYMLFHGALGPALSFLVNEAGDYHDCVVCPALPPPLFHSPMLSGLHC